MKWKFSCIMYKDMMKAATFVEKQKKKIKALLNKYGLQHHHQHKNTTTVTTAGG